MMHRQSEHPIIGKTITGVICRPGSDGQEIVMLQFDDGTCFEVLSARSRRALTGLARQRPGRQEPRPDQRAVERTQLSFFPHDGEFVAA